MRLAAKLVLLYLVGLLLIVGLFSYRTIKQEERLAIANHQKHASDLAATMEPSLQEASEGDDPALDQVVTRWTRSVRHMRVRIVEMNDLARRDRLPIVPLDRIETREEVTTIVMEDAAGRERMITYVPMDGSPDSGAEKKEGGSIEFSTPSESSQQRLRHSIHSSLMTLLGVATLSGIVIVVGGVLMVGKPLQELIDKVQRAGKGDFGKPLELKSHDELGRLATALNEMCDQLSRQRQELDEETASRISTLEQLRHSDRLNTVGRMAAGIAHEIGTPLNVVSGRAELIAGGQLSEQDNRQSASVIKSEAQRITKTVRALLDFARQSTPRPALQPLNDVIEVTAELMRPLATRHGVDLQLEMPDHPVQADFDAGQIQQVLTNLTVNAIQSSQRDGRVTIRLSDGVDMVDDVSNSSDAVPFRKVSIIDNGSGIAPSDLDHIFEPFFTTKDVGDGTGLGLSISHGIVQEHGGRIEVTSELGKGSCFQVFLPSVAHEAKADTFSPDDSSEGRENE